uniref:Hairy enhancer of split 1 n=1 Tax=Platynereis dumerilii TaxID=6359 RepID=S5TYS9_PLADU|nr:hairy enhancer of split 1 [Platynereis dumerilii]
MGEESPVTMMESQAPSNTALEYKKSTKPIMEKRRRARINASLLELKALLLDVMRQEGVRHQKMEKADILEMAVKHLRQIQKGVGLSTDRYVLNKHNAGFNECANEVSRYLNDTDNVDIDTRTKILDHLMNVVQGGDNDDITQLPGTTLSPVAPSVQSSPPHSISPLSLPSSPVKITGNFVQTVGSLATTTPVLSNGQMAAVSQMQVILRQGNSPTVVQCAAAPPTTVIPAVNTPSQMLGGLQLIPVQLSNGEVVFAIPKQQQQQAQQIAVSQQQTTVAPIQLTEADDSAQERTAMTSPPNQVTIDRNSPVPSQQHHRQQYQQHHPQAVAPQPQTIYGQQHQNIPHNLPPQAQHSPPPQEYASPPQKHCSPPQKYSPPQKLYSPQPQIQHSPSLPQYHSSHSQHGDFVQHSTPIQQHSPQQHSPQVQQHPTRLQHPSQIHHISQLQLSSQIQHPAQMQHSPPQMQHSTQTQHSTQLQHSPQIQHSPQMQHSPQQMQLQPHLQTTTVARPTGHQTVIKHTSPKSRVDQNNNGYRSPPNQCDALNLKKEIQPVSCKGSYNCVDDGEKQEKIDLSRYQAYVDHRRKMEALNYNLDPDQYRSIHKKLSHHGLIYKSMANSRFQPYSTPHHRFSQELNQQEENVWRPW